MSTQFSNGRSAWRGSNPTRQLDGLSQPLTRSLESMTQDELRAQYEKTSVMLNNPNLKLPDGGSKLKTKLEQIEQLLSSSTHSITDKVSNLSLNNKKESLLRSTNTNVQPSNLLRAHNRHQTNPNNAVDTDMEQTHSRSARMMSLEESMKLQESQQKSIKLANMKKKMESVRGTVKDCSLADDLSLTMNRLRLDPETRQPRPDDDGPSDGEGGDADSIDDTDSDEEEDMEDYERYDDEGFEEEDQPEFEDGQVHNNNNRRV